MRPLLVLSLALFGLALASPSGLVPGRDHHQSPHAASVRLPLVKGDPREERERERARESDETHLCLSFVGRYALALDPSPEPPNATPDWCAPDLCFCVSRSLFFPCSPSFPLILSRFIDCLLALALV